MSLGIAAIIIIALNVIFSYQGFQNYYFIEKYLFRIHDIIYQKDYKRMVTSGFLHADWNHLFFNMLTLYFFADAVESSIGEFKFVILYVASLIGGNLLALFIHRNEGHYSALGASGAVSGVVFASIVLYPEMTLRFFFLPIDIPGWVYALIYVGYSIRGIKNQSDNIGHDAHLGGGLVGVLVAILFVPNIIFLNPLPILLITIPSAIFLYLIVKKPELFR